MHYSQAPLPFTGQKRNFLKYFQQILKENISNKGQDWTIIDAFGGSGLLAHTAKQTLPEARVIFNDFDGYTERLAHIDDTNRLRELIFNRLNDLNVPKNQGLIPKEKAEIEVIIHDFGGYKDVISLGSWLLFSGRQVNQLSDLFNQNWYRKIRETPYPSAVGYLDDVEIVQRNAHELLPDFVDSPRVLLVLDPPYVCTEQGSYRQGDYFGMVQFLRLMSVVRPPFVFFSSTRSEFLAYLDFVIETKQAGWERFVDYRKISIHTSLNKQSRYEDNLVFKFE